MLQFFYKCAFDKGHSASLPRESILPGPLYDGGINRGAAKER